MLERAAYYHHLFLLFDWNMKASTSGGNHGIKWTACVQLDDSIDDLAVLSHAQRQIQVETVSVAADYTDRPQLI